MLCATLKLRLERAGAGYLAYRKTRDWPLASNGSQFIVKKLRVLVH
ncbi:MAG: hypothetical protein GXP25_14170 [Planctomycetes bacterium]|nr:hypothetical protein [Planctomycetota bacterium]